MYKNIEKGYKKINPENQFFRYYWKWATIIGLAMMIISSIGISNKILLPIMVIVLLVLVILYEYKNYKKYISEENKNKKFKEKLEIYFDSLNKQLINDIIAILNKENINAKNDILLVINYYNKKRPLIVKTSIWERIASIVITVASFVVVFVDDKNKTIDYDKLLIVLGSIFGIVAVVLIMYLFLKFFTSVRKSNESFYSELEEHLTHIYINYKDYEYRLKKKS